MARAIASTGSEGWAGHSHRRPDQIIGAAPAQGDKRRLETLLRRVIAVVVAVSRPRLVLAQSEKAGVLAAAIVDLPRRWLPQRRKPVAIGGQLRAQAHKPTRRAHSQSGQATRARFPRAAPHRDARHSSAPVALAQIEVIRGASLHQTQRLGELERRTGKGRVGRITDAQDDCAGGGINDGTVTSVDGLEAFIAQAVGQWLGRGVPMGSRIGVILGPFSRDVTGRGGAGREPTSPAGPRPF